MTITLDLTDEESHALATVVRQVRPPDAVAPGWYGALDKISKQLPETYGQVIRGAVFEQLKADVLQGLAEADAGNTVSEEEMRAMFGLTEKS
jgi:predicted transcriptional regulator